MTTKPKFEMRLVKGSSRVTHQGYDPATKTLAVSFKDGGTYHYHGITPDMHTKLMGAESFGTHLHQHIIKPKFKFTKQP